MLQVTGAVSIGYGQSDKVRIDGPDNDWMLSADLNIKIGPNGDIFIGKGMYRVAEGRIKASSGGTLEVGMKNCGCDTSVGMAPSTIVLSRWST